jgi:hypothetical protein
LVVVEEQAPAQASAQPKVVNKEEEQQVVERVTPLVVPPAH